MAFDSFAFHAALAAAVGDDPALAAELRDAFLAGARVHADGMRRSRCDANWRQSALRLRGLAASFGATELIRAATEAIEAAPHDPVALRRVARAITAYSG